VVFNWIRENKGKKYVINSIKEKPSSTFYLCALIRAQPWSTGGER
jgi:hypothetical protein